MKSVRPVLLPAFLAVLAAACAPTLGPVHQSPQPTPVAINSTSLPGGFSGESTVFVGAGDVAYEGPGAEATAKLLDRIPGAVFGLGDLAYQSGSHSEFAKYYAPTWGRHRHRTFPVPGNHEYRTPGAAGYFDYFGPRAGDPVKGYYSFDLNADWHVVAINSATVGDGASKHLVPGSAQYEWLSRDLDAHRHQNVIAMWHHPRFSSGAHGDNSETDAIWRLLHAKGVDIALWGHDHHYERFHKMDGDGKRNDQNGLHAFVVGSGGKNHYPFFKFAKRTTAVRNSNTFGVLKLTLYKQGYEWEFVPEAGGKFTDSGRAAVR